MVVASASCSPLVETVAVCSVRVRVEVTRVEGAGTVRVAAAMVDVTVAEGRGMVVVAKERAAAAKVAAVEVAMVAASTAALAEAGTGEAALAGGSEEAQAVVTGKEDALVVDSGMVRVAAGVVAMEDLAGASQVAQVAKGVMMAAAEDAADVEGKASVAVTAGEGVLVAWAELLAGRMGVLKEMVMVGVDKEAAAKGWVVASRVAVDTEGMRVGEEREVEGTVMVEEETGAGREAARRAEEAQEETKAVVGRVAAAEGMAVGAREVVMAAEVKVAERGCRASAGRLLSH